VARSHEAISPQVIALRHAEQPDLAGGVEMGLQVLTALGFESGFTHMEWYRKADGEVVFGEIGGRPPGAHQVDQMNYACDIDVFRGWADAVAFGRFRERCAVYNAANVTSAEGGQESGSTASTTSGAPRAVVWENLLPVGSPAATGSRRWFPTVS
jgi:hypothetical protein